MIIEKLLPPIAKIVLEIGMKKGSSNQQKDGNSSELFLYIHLRRPEIFVKFRENPNGPIILGQCGTKKKKKKKCGTNVGMLLDDLENEEYKYSECSTQNFPAVSRFKDVSLK